MHIPGNLLSIDVALLPSPHAYDIIFVQSRRCIRSSAVVALLRLSVSSPFQITNCSFRNSYPHLWNQLSPSLRQPHSTDSRNHNLCHTILHNSHPITPTLFISDLKPIVSIDLSRRTKLVPTGLSFMDFLPFSDFEGFSFYSFNFYGATACNATHGIAVAILSVRLSVCLSDACIVIKLNDGLRIF